MRKKVIFASVVILVLIISSFSISAYAKTDAVNANAPQPASAPVLNQAPSGAAAAASDITGSHMSGITVTSPGRDETWAAGSTRMITWTPASVNESVKIEFSGDSGATWTTIVPAAPDSGSKTWVVTAPIATTHARMRVSRISLPFVSSVSAADFTVTRHDIDFGSWRLRNNLWGAPAQETLPSDIYINADGAYGWYWDRSNPQTLPGLDYVQPIFPSVRVGGSIWESSTTRCFPVQLADVKSLELSIGFNYDMLPTGKYDLAYDFFLTNTNQPSDNPGLTEIQAEVMVWLNGTVKPPEYTADRGDFSDGDNTYSLYSGYMSDGRAYYAFIMKDSPQYAARYTINVRKLLDILRLNPDWYINGIELGNEVWNGSGKIEINHSSLELNGVNL